MHPTLNPSLILTPIPTSHQVTVIDAASFLELWGSSEGMDNRLDLGLGAEQAWSTGVSTGAGPGLGGEGEGEGEPGEGDKRPGLGGEGDTAPSSTPSSRPSRSVVQLLVEQAEVADVLLLNKRDQVDAAQMATLEQILGAVNGFATLLPAEYGRVLTRTRTLTPTPNPTPTPTRTPTRTPTPTLTLIHSSNPINLNPNPQP